VIESEHDVGLYLASGNAGSSTITISAEGEIGGEAAGIFAGREQVSIVTVIDEWPMRY
jgi:hypothetical protein